MAASPPVTAGRIVLAARWFRLDDLPAASELAHGGWADDVLRRLQARPS